MSTYPVGCEVRILLKNWFFFCRWCDSHCSVCLEVCTSKCVALLNLSVWYCHCFTWVTVVYLD